MAMLLAAPAVASASPRWFINDTLAGPVMQNVVAVGSLTLDFPFVGEWKCGVLAGVPVRNEGGNGLASVESWSQYDCSTASCPGAAYVTTEAPVELLEKEIIKGSEKEVEYSAKRAPRSLPWPAETAAPEAGVSRLAISRIGVTLECPAEAYAVKFVGGLEPRIVNGAKNGLNPSHLVFEGKGGKTGSLECANGLCDEVGLFLSGELTILGTREELITAE
jgi:hypothetical protein